MVWIGAYDRWAFEGRGWWKKPVVALALFTVLVGPVGAPSASAAPVPPTTTSYYERNANPKVLYRQGEAAGKAGAQGIVILDFGRPGDDGVYDGTMAYNGAFISFAPIAAAIESYIVGYYRYAPSNTNLNVALGTNNSCGTGQPCGTTLSCGCPDEPSDFVAWGEQLARTVEEIDDWAVAYRAEYGYSDNVRAVAADDAEPAYDPSYVNTYDVLSGYAQAVDGTFPTMVDYGSADPDFWTEAELLQVAYGFRPDVPMPQIYYSFQAEEWGALLSYAKSHRRAMAIYGVLTTGAGTNTPQTAYFDMLGAATVVNDQNHIPWLSMINR
jgi:hypothetical protein